MWGQFKAEMLYLLKMHAEQIHFPYCPAEQNGMWVREWLSPPAHVQPLYGLRKGLWSTEELLLL